MSEDELNQRLDVELAIGRADGLEVAAFQALKKAGEHYTLRSDEKAQWWREVSEWLETLAREARKAADMKKAILTGDGKK